MGNMLEVHRVSLNGQEIAFRLEGTGQTLLLIHGIAGDSRTWAEAMRQLARRFRVLAPDLPGHGASAKPQGDYSLGAHASFLRDLLQALHIGHATLVGHSLGGGIALQFAYQFPEQCERIVLVSSGGLGRDVSPLLRALSLPGAEVVLSMGFPGFVLRRGEALWKWLGTRGIHAPGLAEKWNAYVSLSDAESRRAFLRELRAVVNGGGQVVRALGRLDLSRRPILLVWGDRDSIIPLSHAILAHEAIPGSQLEVFPGAEHFPHAEFPGRFAEVLTRFIESTAPGQVVIPA
jgi:pimeloyl-ACP methyl ester carboxylesterase